MNCWNMRNLQTLNPPKKAHIFHLANSHSRVSAWGYTLLWPVRVKGSFDSWHHGPPQHDSWHFIIDESNLGPGGLAESLSALVPASGKLITPKLLTPLNAMPPNTRWHWNTPQRINRFSLSHTLSFTSLPPLSARSHVQLHLLKLPRSQVKLFTLGGVF